MENKFVDAQEMAAENPESFYVPSQEELDNLEGSNHLKICSEPERFWVLVTSIDGDNVVGVVHNDLVHTEKHGLSYNDEVKFEKRHIYDILVSPKMLDINEAQSLTIAEFVYSNQTDILIKDDVIKVLKTLRELDLIDDEKAGKLIDSVVDADSDVVGEVEALLSAHISDSQGKGIMDAYFSGQL